MPEMPVIFITGYSRGLLPQDFKPDAYRDLLMKPFSRNELISRVREFLDRTE